LLPSCCDSITQKSDVLHKFIIKQQFLLRKIEQWLPQLQNDSLRRCILDGIPIFGKAILQQHNNIHPQDILSLSLTTFIPRKMPLHKVHDI
jgi:hypothetical protein